MYRQVYIIFTLLFLCSSISAQNIISGKIIRAVDKSAIAYASVFFNNSSIGNTTEKDGSFILSGIRNGHYDLVITCIGFETYHQDVTVYNSDVHLVPIELQTQVNALSEVKIIEKTGKVKKKDPNRNRYIQMFTQAFLGNSKNATACKILNPEFLNFDFNNQTDELTATSRDFLIIENKALGYRIKYLLVSFLISPGKHIISYTGPSIFIPIDSTAEQKKIWKAKRMKSYYGSEMHFLRDCISGKLAQDGFIVKKLIRTPVEGREPDSTIYANIKRYSVSPNDATQLHYWTNQAKQASFDQKIFDKRLNDFEFIKTTDVKGIYAIGYAYCLIVNYENLRSTSSTVTFVEPFSYFDDNGIITNPLSNRVEGYWGTKRVADLLPVDYDPSEKLK